MHIRKDTWHYRVWDFTYCLDGLIDWWGQRPLSPNLCQYVRRIALFTLPTAIVVGIGIAVAIVVMLVIQSAWVLSGTGIYMGRKDGESYYFPPVGVGRHRIRPRRLALWTWGMFALAGIAHYGAMYSATIFDGILAPIGQVLLSIGPYVLGFLAIVAVLCLIAFAFKASSESETWGLFRAYLKAKKEGICPRIEFVGGGKEEQAA